jgi:predicted amidophosphoribosyltransferase
MCGCMLMHGMMSHEGHQPGSQSAPAPAANAMPATAGQRCLHCGFPLQQGFAFCPGCGMNLRTVQCPACGQKVEPNWRACAYCGSPLGEVQTLSAHH